MSRAFNQSWLSRVLNNDDFQTSPMALELPVRRSFTPLRPSAAALAHRVDAAEAQQQQRGAGFSLPPIGINSGVTPLKRLPDTMDPIVQKQIAAQQQQQQQQTAESKNSPVSARSAGAHSSNTSGRGASKRSAAGKQQPQPHSLVGSAAAVSTGIDLASPLRDLSRVAAAAPVVHATPPAANDPYAAHEQQIAAEIQQLRADPAAYAGIVEQQLLLARPFLPAAHERLNLAGTRAFVAERAQQLADITQQLEQLDEKHRAEVQALRDQWAADDGDRHKKRKNPAAQPGMKKADAEKALASMLQEQEDKRQAELDEMEHVTEQTRASLRRRMGVVTTELEEARDGVDHLSKLLARLRTARPMIAPATNRGLVICARTVADESALRPEHLGGRYSNLSGSLVEYEQKELPAVVSRFGTATGNYLGLAALVGPVRSPRETVFELLLSLADRKFRRSRHALLDPRGATMGCAWRKKVGAANNGSNDLSMSSSQAGAVAASATQSGSGSGSGVLSDRCDTVTVVVLAAHFSELAVIAERSHLNVDNLRREVTAACAVMNGSGFDSYTEHAPPVDSWPVSPTLARTVVHTMRATPEDPEGTLVAPVEVVAPLAQPSVCGNEAHVVLRCGPNAAVCAVLLPRPSSASDGAQQQQAQPSAPAQLSTVPQFAPGEQLVQRDAADATLVHARLKLPSRGRHYVALFVRDGSDLFRRVAVVAFDARHHDPREGWRRFPVISSDFADRAGLLLEPLDGVLPPDSEVVFRVSLPVSAHYKGREMQRVKRLIAEARAQDEHCARAIEALRPKLDEARAALEQAQASKDGLIAGIHLEMSTLQKDLHKRKAGKEHDRLKHAVSDAEMRIATITTSVNNKRRAVELAEGDLQGYHKTRQQTAAMLLRYEEEQRILQRCTDRSKPLLVELATDERRATLAPAEDGSEVYAARIRTPGVGGHVSLFVGGAMSITFDVLPPPPHFLASVAAKPLRLDEQ